MAAALSRMVKVQCPHCRHHKLVERRPVAFRLCPRCHHRFADPLGGGRTTRRR